MSKGILKKLYKAREKVEQEISGHAKSSSLNGAVSGEGYSGGYRDAISDVILLLNGTTPNRRNYYENEDIE